MHGQKCSDGLSRTADTQMLTERDGILMQSKGGSPAPDFMPPDADGNPVSLSSLRGQVVLMVISGQLVRTMSQREPEMQEDLQGISRSRDLRSSEYHLTTEEMPGWVLWQKTASAGSMYLT